MMDHKPSKSEMDRAVADFDALTAEEWQPVDNDEVQIHVEGQNVQPGSMYAIGRSGLVFIQSPDGKLSIVTGGIERISKPTITGGPNSIEMKQEGEQLFLYVEGRKIAKRGLPGTARARKWIPIVPDVRRVIDISADSITVEYNEDRPLTKAEKLRARHA
jgi:hypothetical protein